MMAVALKMAISMKQYNDIRANSQDGEHIFYIHAPGQASRYGVLANLQSIAATKTATVALSTYEGFITNMLLLICASIGNHPFERLHQPVCRYEDYR